jgi:hypothetical protein
VSWWIEQGGSTLTAVGTTQLAGGLDGTKRQRKGKISPTLDLGHLSSLDSLAFGLQDLHRCPLEFQAFGDIRHKLHCS